VGLVHGALDDHVILEVRNELEGEVAVEAGQQVLELQESELLSKAGSGTTTEGQVGGDGALGFSRGVESLRVELLRVGPEALVHVQEGKGHSHVVVFLRDNVADGLACVDLPDNGGRDGLHAEGLVDDLANILEISRQKVVVCEGSVPSEGVQGGDELGLNFGCLGDVEEGEGEGVCCRLMSGDQKGDHVVDNVLLGHLDALRGLSLPVSLEEHTQAVVVLLQHFHLDLLQYPNLI